jgi:hypothetical protein
MTRRRYIYDPATKELVEVPLNYRHEPRDRQDLLWNDRIYDNLRATDGTDISSRRKHQTYMKQNGLTIADDFKNEWKQKAKERADFFQGKDTSRRDDIGRAMYKLESKRR